MTHPMLAEILGPDLLVILLLVALLFGGARLPKLARSLGSAKSEFEKGLREGSWSSPPLPAEQEQVTLTRSELDALIAEREARARRFPSDTGPAE
jgi:sec-independent protein translocase protein TatA